MNGPPTSVLKGDYGGASHQEERGEDLETFLARTATTIGVTSDSLPQPTSSEDLRTMSFDETDRYPMPPPSPTATPLFDPIVTAVGVVGFDHTIGAILEYMYPPLPSSLSSNSSVLNSSGVSGLALPDEWRFLPALALPDGCHH